MTARILITPGEPAGIGPELLLQLVAQHPAEQDLEWVAVADPALLADRAAALDIPVQLTEIDARQAIAANRPGELKVIPVPLDQPAAPGQLDPRNARYVINTLDTAIDLCHTGQAAALVTGPVQKSVINEAGIAFSGHTEYLQQRCGVPRVVMMLANEQLRVALVTTHLPLRAVPDAITAEVLEQTIVVLEHSLREQFRIPRPAIAVLGLNPHAGENGHLGREELETIIPCVQGLRRQGLQLEGPLAADTAFSSERLGNTDAFLAMYHDQGLTVLKFAGFGDSVNITLGLPFVRVSVDHGTALDLAGSGRGDHSSLRHAIVTAARLAASRD